MMGSCLTLLLTICFSVVSGGYINVQNMKMNYHYDMFSEWSAWSKCTESVCCRHGVTSRRRHCIITPCTGIENESDDCPRRNCEGIMY